MYNRFFRLAVVVSLTLGVAASAEPKQQNSHKTKDLRVVVVDVEGGSATLFVTPEGKTLLIDTGWDPGGGRPRPKAGEPPPPPTTSSAERIAAAAESLGVKKIDYLLMTHYHVDHAGGLASLLEKLPVDTYIDHGPNREELAPNASPAQAARASATLYSNWTAAYAGHGHITARAGEKLKIGSLELDFVSSDGQIIDSAMPGAGQANPMCAGVEQKDRTGGEENVRSLGMVMTFGKTRLLDLGDLTWNKELELLCPANRIGKVDIYFVTGHGMDLSSSPPTAALDPLVALMQNGPTKGGDAAVLNTVKSFPDMQGLWQEHYSVRFPELNSAAETIANLDQQPDMAYPIAMEITPGGEITVRNGRSGYSKVYRSRASQKRGGGK